MDGAECTFRQAASQPSLDPHAVAADLWSYCPGLFHRAFAVDLIRRPIDQLAPEAPDAVLRRFFHLMACVTPPEPGRAHSSPPFRKLSQQEPTAIRSAHVVRWPQTPHKFSRMTSQSLRKYTYTIHVADQNTAAFLSRCNPVSVAHRSTGAGLGATPLRACGRGLGNRRDRETQLP